MPHPQQQPLSAEDIKILHRAQESIRENISLVKAANAHRSLSLAITKLEEANLWIQDRLNKPTS